VVNIACSRAEETSSTNEAGTPALIVLLEQTPFAMKHVLSSDMAKSKGNYLAILRRILVAVLGTMVLLAGILLLVLPGPAILVIPLGLAILGTEFHWAKRSSDKLRHLLIKAKRKMSRRSEGDL